MARIRTIKPEFTQSESVGSLSRDARLLFVQLWTVADDEGRLRAASRMLASTLYPYDDDAPQLIDGWLCELEQGAMIRRYSVNGSTYLEIVNWLKHQKIDKPSKSRLPTFGEGSRTLANGSEASRSAANSPEASAPDLGPRTSTKETDQGSGGALETRERAKAEEIHLEERIATAPAPAKSMISDEAFAISTDILQEMGRDPFDPISVGSPLMVQSWLNGGWNRDCIMAGVQKGMVSRAGDPPSTIKYFEKAIARAHAELSRPLPVVTLQPGQTFNETARNVRLESLGDVARRHAASGISFGAKPTGLAEPSPSLPALIEQ